MLLAAVYLAEMLETDEVHLAVSVLLSACVHVNIDFQFYFHLLLKNVGKLLKKITQTASWYSKFGKSESKIL